MDIKTILKRVDHTLLKPTSMWHEIAELCDDGIRFSVASVCIPPSFVARAKAHAKGRLKICTVIGFPNGYSATAVKMAETAEVIKDGADEIDMVINLCDAKDGRFDNIESEIRRIKDVCGEKILKVIVEACLLTEYEKIKLCEIVTAAGADFIKTSTGFSTGGATITDVKLFRRYIGGEVRVKASGGIKTLAEAEEFIHAGADRLGTSAIVGIVKSHE